MRFTLALAALALAACSSDPAPPADAGQDVAVDLGGPDTGPVDTGIDAPRDTGTDRGPPIDDPPVVTDTGPVDAGCSCDVGDTCNGQGQCVPIDAGEERDTGLVIDTGIDVPTDTGVDAGVDTGVDTGVDAGPADTGADTGVDVPRDTGPVDAGPQTYDLEATRTGLEVYLLARRTSEGGTLDCPPDIASATCTVTGNSLSFSVRACYGVTFSGLADLRTSGPYALSFGEYFANVVQLQRGRAGERRSFRVSFSAQPPPETRRTSYQGIPGRTVDPALADLWLLGCPVM